jgi:hypothetical protein
MSTSPAAPDAALTPEAFQRALDLYRDRGAHPDALAQLLSADPAARSAHERLQNAYAASAAQMDRSLRGIRDPKNFRKWPFSDMATSRPAAHFRTASRELLTYELAFALADLSRVARMDANERSGLRLSPDFEFSPSVAETLGAERSLAWEYPLVSAMYDAAMLPKRRELAPEDARLPFDVAIDAVRDLQRLQEAIRPDRRADRPVAALNIRARSLPAIAEKLSSPEMLSDRDLAEALELAHGPSERWHSGFARTKTPKGAFTHGLVERLTRHGPAEHLVCAAGVTGGSLRAAAAHSKHTPVDIYQTLALDNSIGVLMNVVASPHFNDWLAREMLKPNRAAQNVAVMANGWGRVKADDWKNVPASDRKIMMELRVQACEQSIHHDGVSPIHVYEFLSRHGLADDVPHKLWTDFIAEMKRRLDIVRLKGSDKEVEAFEKRIHTFAKRFVEEVFRVYREQVSLIDRIDERNASPQWRGYGMSGSLRSSYENAKRYVDAWDMVMEDEATLNMVVEGAPDDDTLVDLLRFQVQRKRPVTDKLLVTLLRHDNMAVRQQAMSMLPNISPERVEEARMRLEARKSEDMERVRDAAMVKIKADYEEAEMELEAAPRDLSRNRYSFRAADVLSLDELRDTYMRAARTSPKNIPDAFQEELRAREIRAAGRSGKDALSGRIAEALADANAGISFVSPDSGMVEQTDLFGRSASPPSHSR